jgi:glucose-1-phosphate thymidylyltransferase
MTLDLEAQTHSHSNHVQPAWKGIILAGGSGTRLYPVTRAISKQLAPVYDKPMVYYPLATLMMAGIRDIMVINTPHEQECFQRLLGSGSEWGVRFEYAVQPKPEGIAQAFIIAKEFAGRANVALALGDNIFYGHGMVDLLHRATARRCGATVFGYWVKDPERYGVVEFDAAGTAIGLEEKPTRPRSSWAITGLYFYDNRVFQLAEGLVPSARGELEITDLNREFLKSGDLHVEKMGRGIAWLDTGTHDALMQASSFIQAIEERQGLQVACLEEIAWRMGYIGKQDVIRIADSMANSRYGQYLRHVLELES